MIRVRLSKQGKRNSPFFRIVANEKRSKRSGGVLAILGFWNPLKNEFKLDMEKYNSFISKGAIASDSLKKLIEEHQ